MANYSDKVFELAERELSARRENAERTYNQRKSEMYRISPEVRGICEKLEATGLEFLSIMTDKNGNKNDRIEQLKNKNLKMQDDLAMLLKGLKNDETYLDIPYTCKKCGDTGFANGVRCECYELLLKKVASKELTDNCGIELHDFSEFRLDYYPETDSNGDYPRMSMKKNFIYCRDDYTENFDRNKPSLLFIGMTGIGKTFLSSCIAKKLTELGFSVVFGSVSTYLRRIDDEHFGRAVGDTFGILGKCDLLILDDLGSEFRTQFTESALYEIINSRINMRKPTIISTNLTKDDLNKAYNERIVSRLTGCFNPLWFRGKDIRPMVRNC